MSTLLNYINELDSNSDLHQAHQKAPEASMKGYGLKEDEIKAVMSGDMSKIAALTGVDDPEFAIKSVHVQQSIQN